MYKFNTYFVVPVSEGQFRIAVLDTVALERTATFKWTFYPAFDSMQSALEKVKMLNEAVLEDVKRVTEYRSSPQWPFTTIEGQDKYLGGRANL